MPSVRLESQEGRTTDTMQHIYNGKVVFVWLPTDVAGSLLHMHVRVLTICVHASHPLLEGHKWHIPIRDLEPTVLRGIAAYCNGICYRIFLHVIICEFSLHTSVNCTENVTELLLSDFF